MGRICYDIHIYSQYSWHILGIFTSYFRHILAYSRKSSKKYWIYIFSHIGAYSKIFNIPPPKTECVRICPEYPYKYAEEFGSKISHFSKKYIHFHIHFIFTSYWYGIGDILLQYSKIFKYWIFCSFLSHIQYKHPTGPKFENIRKFIFWHIGVIFSIFSQTRPPAEYAEYAVNIIKICPRI